MIHSVTFHCVTCNCPLEQCDDLEHECDEMWIAPAYDGQGGERVYCENCFPGTLMKGKRKE
jgi:hypothetical protein